MIGSSTWLLLAILSFGPGGVQTLPAQSFDHEVNCHNRLRELGIAFPDDGGYPFLWLGNCYEIAPIDPWPWSQIDEINPAWFRFDDARKEARATNR